MRRLVLLLPVFFIFAVTVFSEVPNEISYNGVLRSYINVPERTSRVNFRIYDKEKGGMAVWESGDQDIKFLNGVFSSILRPDITKVDWRKKDFWLELVIDGKEFLPRAKLTSQIYSLHSNAAENLSSNSEIKIEVGTSSGYIGINDSKMYYKSSKNADAEYFGIPPGTVIAFAGNKVPNGYLLCDGRAVDKRSYPGLFEAISTTYGGSGSTFKLPDFRGMFLRVAGSQTVVRRSDIVDTTYASKALGEIQGDAIRNIKGSVLVRGIEYKYGEALEVFDILESGNSTNADNKRGGKGAKIRFDASKVVPTSNENRPVNCAVNYCIKY
ncbi:MAG: phage tail protein [Endomicrobium sp.]|jgi:hypothetical protein|nr:phage tail protein [Endomicrobium sp.]